MVRNALTFLVRLAGVSLLVIALSGAGHLILNPGSDPTGPAGQAVVDLAAGKHLGDKVPPGFAKTMGYLPTSEGGRPDGSCSTQGGVSYTGFTEACRIHDFGYDLLRYADERGEPLGPWARLAIDRRFHQDMVASCDDPGCWVLAHVYGFFAGLNSVRQGFTAPAEEPGGPWAILGVLSVVAALPPSARHPRFRRQPGGLTTPLADG